MTVVKTLYKPLFLFVSILCWHCSHAQTSPKDSGNFIRMPASGHYHKSSFYRKMWGEHYRAEWHTPVLFQKALLDTLAGGLLPYQVGGGRQTRSVRLKDGNNREYVLRSIDKTFSGALPDIAKGSFLEDIANDQVTFAHPYAPLVVAPLAEAAGLYHTNPVVRYIPRQEELQPYNDSAGDILYLFEQRPDGNWATAKNFANSEKIISTEKMLENILEDNDHLVEQATFLRARLFDMVIGDWGRHEDQWRWAAKKTGKQTIYYAIPRDRDNAFTRMDGFLLKKVLSAAGGDHMQSFGPVINDVPAFNFTARHMDRHLLSAQGLAEWKAIAVDIQNRLTDATIENAVKQIPPEVYPISGPSITASLKNRRNLLVHYAEKYYRFLAGQTEVTGSEKNELFEVELSDTGVVLAIFKTGKDGTVKDSAFFSRVFRQNETSEIRLYGIDGNDRFVVKGEQSPNIKVKLIGSKSNNDYQVDKEVSRSVYIYDDKQAATANAKGARLRLSDDSSTTAYQYDYFRYNKAGFRPVLFYSNFDRFYAGLSYNITRHKWRSEPFAAKHHIGVKYSFGQKAMSSDYFSIFPNTFGRWDLNLLADFDLVRWRNFYGLGNENTISTNRDFNRVRSKEFMGKAGVSRSWDKKRSRFYVNAMFQHYDVIKDTGRIVAKIPGLQSEQLYNAKQFAGAEMGYVFMGVNNTVLATKGLAFFAGVDGLQNLEESSRQLMRYQARVEWFRPVGPAFGLRISGAAATLSGNPEFYQYNSIGGTNSMRGFQRDRFYGNTTFASQNEVRYLRNVRTRIFNGKAGVFGFYDLGRVWLNGQKNNQWHSGYGAGVIIVPFNKIAFSASYGKSKDDSNFHFDIIRTLF